MPVRWKQVTPACPGREQKSQRTHNPEIARLADRVTVLSHGSVQAEYRARAAVPGRECRAG